MDLLSRRYRWRQHYQNHPWSWLLLASLTMGLILALLPVTPVHASWLGDTWDSIRNVFGSGATSQKTSNFTSFSQLMQTMGDKGFDGKIDDNTKQAAARWWYLHWGEYLKPTLALNMILIGLGGSFVRALYNFTAGLENVYEHIFNLFGLFGYFDGKSDSVIAKVFHGLQTTGVVIFTCALIGYAVMSMFKSRPKYKDVLIHFVFASLVIAVLPWGISKFSTAIRTDITNSIGTNSSLGSLALQPIKDNTVDLLTLVAHDFDTTGKNGFKLDKYGRLKNVSQANWITDNTDKRDSANYIGNIDFGASYGVATADELDKLNDKQPGIKGLFQHQLNNSGTQVVPITEHRFVKGVNAFENVYPRYQINFLPAIAEYLVLIVLLISMSLKLVKSIFQVVMACIVAPVIAYTELEESRKTKEVIGEVVGGIAGTFFEVVTLRVTLEIMKDLPNLKVFDGLSSWEHAIAAIIVYLGLFFGALQGISIVERWLGVSTGHGDTMQQLMGATMLGAAAAGTTVGAARLGMGTGKLAAKGIKAMPKVAGKAGSGLAAAAGALEGAGTKVRNQGFGKTAASGLTNLTQKAGQKIGGGLKTKGQAVADQAKTAYGKGYAAAGQALQNNAPTAEDMLRDPSLDLGGHTNGEGNPNAREANTVSGTTNGFNSVESRQHMTDVAEDVPTSETSSSVTAGGNGIGTPATTSEPSHDAPAAGTGLGGVTASDNPVEPAVTESNNPTVGESVADGPVEPVNAPDTSEPVADPVAGGDGAHGIGDSMSAAGAPPAKGLAKANNTPQVRQTMPPAGRQSYQTGRNIPPHVTQGPITQHASGATPARVNSSQATGVGKATTVAPQTPPPTVNGASTSGVATQQALVQRQVINSAPPTTGAPRVNQATGPVNGSQARTGTAPAAPQVPANGPRHTPIGQDFRQAKQNFTQAKNQFQQGMQYINQGNNRPPHK